MTQAIVNFSSHKNNEREFTILDPKKEIKATIKLNTITSLNIGGANFNIGDLWKHKNAPYKIFSIKKEPVEYRGTRYILSIVPFTKSSIFILPMLGGHRTDYLYSDNFINCYLATEEAYRQYNKIILSYRFSGSMRFKEFENQISSHSLYDSEYEPDSFHVNYVFNIPKDYEEDYKLFLDGKYSQFDENYKKEILNFHSFEKEGSTGGILYKSKERKELLVSQLFNRADRDQFPKDAELLSIPSLKEETFLNTYKIKDYDRTRIGGISPEEIS